MAQEGLHRLASHVGRKGDGVKVHRFEIGFRIHPGGVSDIAALGIGNKELVGMVRPQVVHRLLQDAQPLRALALVKSQVGLEGHAEGCSGIDDGLVKVQYAHPGGQFRGIGVQAYAQHRVLAPDAGI